MQITTNFIPYKMEHSQDCVVVENPLLKDEFLSTYEKALQYSELSLYKELSFRNVRIYQKDFMHQVYTMKQSNLPHIVLLHGYGGTSLTFIRLFSEIYDHYQVHALDAFGIGYSSRGNWDDKFTYEETRDYYVNAIEEWRKALKIQKFYIAGHSFGGYLATMYVEKFPNNIEKLFLLSPVGGTDYNHENEMKEEVGCKRKAFLCLGQTIYNRNIRPTTAFTNCIFGEKFLENALGGRLKLVGEQKQIWKKYLKQIATQQQSSEVGFYRLFEWPLATKKPIENVIRKQEFKFEIYVYFGDSDWMNRNGADRLAEEKKVNVQTIQNAGHQLIMDNPKKLGSLLVKNK